mmetsp:Transcript_28537/g.51647  ORF Transcript_28537/g.51647 Transcript_28537/m.51647 type:complete len:350 (-) Transcript_28537:46-1095(-)
MGLVNSVISNLEWVMGRVMHGLLMPKAAPAWYAGSRRITAFPEAPAESLLLLAHVALKVVNAEAARRFFIDGLGASKVLEADCPYAVDIGACRFQLVPADKSSAHLAEAWPGHFYIWVEDTKKALTRCRNVETALKTSIVEEVYNIKGDDAVDALVVQDPSGNNRFIVNQVPVGGMVSSMRQVLKGSAKEAAALAVIDVLHLVPAGALPAVERFYSHFLGTALVAKKQGKALNFSLGSALNQTLTFVEDDSLEMPGSEDVPEVCMYVLSKESLKAAFTKCAEAGIVEGPGKSWKEVEKRSEFQFTRCIDPADGTKTVMKLSHIIRAPDHKDWPIPKDAATRATTTGVES